MRALHAAVMVALMAMPAATQALDFDASATEACLAAAPTDPATCIGHAADACMVETPGGETTVGMGECLSAEHAWWLERLGAAEAGVAAATAAADAEMRAIGATVPSQSDAFATMRTAWKGWRQAACDWELAQWGSGTGGGPATTACHLRLTGQRALELERWLAERAAR
jgi:uncharacterized protein YecT (DUF1311 family)